jgi:hypothetical protein
MSSGVQELQNGSLTGPLPARDSKLELLVLDSIPYFFCGSPF